jgi:acetyl esterase/lipase
MKKGRLFDRLEKPFVFVVVTMLHSYLFCQGHNQQVQAPEYDFRIKEGVQYAPSTSLRLKLDVAYPVNTPRNILVIMMHGGGWDKGDKDVFRSEMEYLAKKGWPVATINYRLSNEAVFPAQYEDVWSAVRYFSHQYPNIVLLGHSAGGHLAALAGLHQPVTEKPKNLIKGIISLDGVHDMRYETLKRQNWPFRSIFERLLGGSLDDPVIQGLAVRASPIAYVDSWKDSLRRAPKILLIHGKKDFAVPQAQFRDFAEALENADFSLVQAQPDSGHYVWYEQREQTFALIEQFLESLENGLEVQKAGR